MWSGLELNQAVSVWGEMLAGQPQAGRPKVWHQGQMRPIGNVQCGTLFFSFWQPQEMLKRMVVYQTAFRQVKRYPLCVCDPPCHPVCLPLLTFLGVLVGSEVAPSAICWEPRARAVSSSPQPGFGEGLLSGVGPGLVRLHA